MLACGITILFTAPFSIMSNTQDTCSVSLLFALIVIPASIVPVTLFSPYTVFNTSTFSTSKSFNYTIQEGALDDYELLEELREIDKGNTSLIVDVIEKIIGSEQKEQLKKHVRDETGRVSIKRMVDEIGEILRGNQQGKNS